MNIDGNYDCSAKTPLGNLPVILKISSAGEGLQIDCFTRWGNKSVTGTRLSDQEFAFSSYVTSPVGEVFLEVTARVEGDKINGRVKAGNFGSASLKGRRV